jgi:proteasome-associated ATPase
MPIERDSVVADETGSRTRALEERLLETKGQLAAAIANNEKLSFALREARDHVATLREEVEKLTQPPSGYGVVLGRNDDGSLDVMTNGRKMRVTIHPELDASAVERGQEVVLNDSLNVVAVRDVDTVGEVVSLKEVLDDGVRVIVSGRADESLVCELADRMRGSILRSGDLLRIDPRTQLVLERLEQPEVDHLLLESVPDVSYGDIGGLDSQIDTIADAVELPFLHADLFTEYQLPAPKGILLYGPPGCG